MKNLYVALFLSFAISNYTNGQNLVPNGDFESIEMQACRSCDDTGDFEHMVFPWKAPVQKGAPQVKTFDHAKVNKGLAFVESPIPYSGDMMVAFHPYQYLTVELETSLKPNRRYYAELWVALSPEAKAACNNIGMFFSSTGVKCEPYDEQSPPLNVKPQLMESTVIKTGPDEKWHKVAGIFTAQQELKYLTIGNFTPMAQTNVEAMNGNSSSEGIYYYLDNVIVLPATEEVLAARSDELSNGSTFRLENVTFETGNANLTQGSHPELDNVARKMNLDPSANLQISGHTDNVGNEQNNVQLSTDRAESIKAYLVARGINSDRIYAKGYGSSRPVASNDSDSGRAQNRRVEITIVKE